LEIGYNQAADIKKLLEKNFKNIQIMKDYSKIERFILATRR
jgi:methylase of polypeptide subunit release factors